MRRRQVNLAKQAEAYLAANPPPVPPPFDPRVDCEKCGRRIGRGMTIHKRNCKGVSNG